MPSFTRRTELAAPVDEAFAWHERPGSMERLLPPWHAVEIVRSDGVETGDRATLRFGSKPLAGTWELVHSDYDEGKAFSDVQVKGPFAHWKHRHRILPHDVDSRLSVLEDYVEYELPASVITQPLAGRTAERELVRLFSYRHRVTREDIARHQLAHLDPSIIAITGSGGLIGDALTSFLTAAGHTVVRVVRSREQQLEIEAGARARSAYWNPARAYIEPGALEGVDAVIHLAGEPLFRPRWTRAARARILDSRARGTRLLADTLASLKHPPSVLLSASGTAYYGDRGDTVMAESERAGKGFLPDVCRAWEHATEGAREAGVRVCHLRFGLVLSPRGGALGAMLPAFRLGFGGQPGSGDGWVPWIALDDALYAILHLLSIRELHGPFNVCAPHPVTTRMLAAELADTLDRPALVRVPMPIVGLVGGGEARRAVGASTRAVPERLANSGFTFAYPRLTAALGHLLGRDAEVATETSLP